MLSLNQCTESGRPALCVCVSPAGVGPLSLQETFHVPTSAHP